jgi:hypothetical protein
LLLIRRSQIFHLTSAVVLLSVQFSCIFQPFYLGFTSVNCDFHVSDTQYNITELTVRH